MAEQVTLAFQLKNLDATLKGLDSFQDALEDITKDAGKLSKSKFELPDIGNSNKLNKAFDGINAQLKGMGSNFLSNIPVIGQFSGSLSSATVAIGGATVSLAALAGAFTVAAASAAVFYALGSRGASLEPQLQAFGNLVGEGQNATQVLNELRNATRNNIPDIQLMTQSVRALAGTAPELRAVLTEQGNLGKIFDVVGRAAQASGKNVEETQTKFIDGLRRQSNLLVDDIGVRVDAEAANRAYAESLGIATAALTDNQKQAAFAAEAIRQLSTIESELGTPAATLENLGAPLVVITNLLDRLAIAIQPAFAPIAQLVADLSFGFQELVTTFMPVVQGIASVSGAVFNVTKELGELSLRTSVFGIALQTLGGIVPYIVATFRLLANAVAGAINGFASALGRINDLLGGVFGGIGGQTDNFIETMASKLSEGAGRIIGAFAAGLLQAGVQVAKAVEKIAEVVAKFLVGESPPPEGPLSAIDQGGANVIKAWADGMVTEFFNLAPAETIANEVNKRLGTIGAFDLPQVEGRLSALDAALQPFVDNLDIAKADVEAIAGALDPALDAIDRQQQQLLSAFARGEASAEAVRQLDKQREQLAQFRDEQQSTIDQAEIQLALAKSQQAQERALLAIQQRRLRATETVTEAVKEQSQAVASAGGGGGARAATGGGGAAAPTGGGGGAAPITDAGGDGAAFGGEAPDIITTEAVANAERVLREGFNKGIEGSGFDEALADFEAASAGVEEQVNRIREADPVGKLEEKFAGIEDTLTAPFRTAQAEIEVQVATIENRLLNFGSTIISTFVNALGEDSPVRGAINSLFGEESPLQAPFSAGGLFAPDGLIATQLESLFGFGGVYQTAFTLAEAKVIQFKNTINTQGNAIKNALDLKFKKPFEDVKTDVETVIDAIESKLKTFTEGDLGLGSLASGLTAKFVTPFLGAVNSVIGLLNKAIEEIVQEVNSASQGLLNITAPSIDPITLDGAARGAIGQTGLTVVGEDGPELIKLTRPTSILPNDVSRELVNSAQNATTNNNQRTINATFNNMSPQQSAIVMRQMEAFNL